MAIVVGTLLAMGCWFYGARAITRQSTRLSIGGPVITGRAAVFTGLTSIVLGFTLAVLVVAAAAA
ncbi:MAG: hypothetical protein AAF567_07355 [Actinomycetota bacterium]